MMGGILGKKADATGAAAPQAVVKPAPAAGQKELASVGDERLDTLVRQWMGWDRNAATRAEIENLVAKKDVDELRKILLKRIAFGTAGLRGPMRAGFSCMNDLTVQQASQGLILAVEELVPEAKQKGVVIGYDGRHHSHEFAQLAARVFLSRGFRVMLYSSVVPTPFVPFCVSQLHCAAGVMVTASHNPKQDNGYKVYWDDGCQIVSPIDAKIAAKIEENLAPWDVYSLPLTIVDPLADISDRYFESISKNLRYHQTEDNATSPLKVTYTAMHGVGARYVKRAFETFGLPPYIGVERQLEPDGDFPTVHFPNPEEGREALDLAIACAQENESPLILATDPDADRLAVAERRRDGSWRLFNGNEIGALFASWAWQHFHERNPTIPANNCVVLTTAVSSKMLSAIAKAEGLVFEETLTGFKWLGTTARRHMAEGRRFVFAYEEAIGFLLGDMSLDKDGVRAAACFAERAGALAKQGKSCADHLDDLYRLYGYHATCNRYFFCYDPAVLDKIFTRLRQGGKYHEQIGKWKINYARDLTVGYDGSREDKKPLLPVSKSTQMITYFFENGCVATLRGSGTEPKLKYYIELPGKFEQKDAVDAELAEIVKAVIEECLQPTANGLVPPSS